MCPSVKINRFIVFIKVLVIIFTVSFLIGKFTDYAFASNTTYDLGIGENATFTNNSSSSFTVTFSGSCDYAIYYSNGQNSQYGTDTFINVPSGRRVVVTNKAARTTTLTGPYETFHPEVSLNPAINYYTLPPSGSITVANNLVDVVVKSGSSCDYADYASNGQNFRLGTDNLITCFKGKRTVITNKSTSANIVKGAFEIFHPEVSLNPAIKYYTLPPSGSITVANNLVDVIIQCASSCDYADYESNGQNFRYGSDSVVTCFKGKRTVITNKSASSNIIKGAFETFNPENSANPAIYYTALLPTETLTYTNNSPSTFSISLKGLSSYIIYNSNGSIFSSGNTNSFIIISSGQRALVTNIDSGPFEIWGAHEVFHPLKPLYLPISGLDSAVYIGELDWDNRESNHFWGDPIETSTGAHFLDRTLFTLNGSRQLIFNLKYNSLLLSEGPMGKGWGHNFEVRLKALPNGNIYIYWSANRANHFVNKGNNQYVSPDLATRFDSLIKNSDGSYTLTRKDQSVYLFNSAGQFTQQKNKYGQILNLFYNAAGRLLTVSEPVSGLSLNFTYNSVGLVEKVSDNTNRQVVFTYDTNHNLVEITDARGENTIYTYNISGQVLTATDTDGVQIFSNTYDSKGRVISQDDAVAGNQLTKFNYDETSVPRTVITSVYDRNGQTRLYSHDSNYQLLSIKDELGNFVVRYSYDGDQNRISATDAVGNVTTFSFDTHGNMLTSKDPNENVTSMSYDECNNLLSAENANCKKTTYIYDNKNNITDIIDTLGNKTTFTYDNNGLMLTKTTPRGGLTTYSYQNGHLKTITDAVGNITTYTYDTAGRPIGITDTAGKTSILNYDEVDNLINISDPLGHKTTFTYDSHRNLLTETDANGNITHYNYNGNGKLLSVTDAVYNTTNYEYDGEDRLVRVVDARGNATIFSYDAKGRLIETTNPLGYTVTNQYDILDRLIAKTDALDNRILTVTYDSLNNPITITDAENHTVTNQYDNLNRLIITTNPIGNSITFDYDDLNRPILVTDPINGRSSQDFDADGNRKALIDANNNQVSFTFDLVGRLITQTNAAGNTLRYSYNARNLLEQTTNGRGQITTYEYDEAGRLTGFTDPSGTVSYSIDANGNILTTTDGNGTISREYDELNRVKTYTDSKGNKIQYSYDALGNLITLTYPGGKQVHYTYDKNNRLITVTDWANRITTYEYDANGRLIKTVRSDGSTLSFNYDKCGQLTYQQDIDKNSNIISQYQYTYDNAGNVIGENGSVPDQPITIQNSVMTYTYDNKLSTYNGQAIVYDADGNMTTGPLNGTRSILGYDSRNRLIKAGNIDYLYDAENNRVSVTESVYGVSTNYVINPHAPFSQVLIENNNQGNQIFYVYGLGLIGQEESDGSYKTYHFDRRGSTVAITNESGNVTDRFQYSPYGMLIYRNGATNTPFLYNGRDGVMTDDNGLYYMRARYYSPEINRFINQDALLGIITNGQSLNRYSYVTGNPVNLIDPIGNWALIDDAIASGAGATVGVASQYVGDVVQNVVNPDVNGLSVLVPTSSWQEYVGAGVGGAAAGETMLYTANPILAGAAEGAVSNATSQGLELLTGNREEFSISEFGGNTFLNTATGVIPVKVRGITSGRNSYEAVFKSGLTKLKNGNARRMSVKVFGKGVTADMLKKLPDHWLKHIFSATPAK